MEAGSDLALTDRHGNTALHLAAQQKDGEMMRVLLKHQAALELSSMHNTAGTNTHTNAMRRKKTVLFLLHLHDEIFAHAGLCPLHIAILTNSLSSVRALLEAGANVEVQERTCGRTPLHLATELDNVSLAGCLLLEVRVFNCVHLHT